MGRLCVAYLDLVHVTIAARSGIIPYEQTDLPRHPRLLQGDGWQLTTLSLVLRASPNDGVIAAPAWWAGFAPYPMDDLPELGRFRWRTWSR